MSDPSSFIYTPLTAEILAGVIEVHKELGPGLLESAYENCLAYELKQRDLLVVQQKELPLQYKGITLDCGYRIDLLIEDKVVIEVKSVNEITKIHEAQLLTYLKLSKCRLGLLINFNEKIVKNGIRRMIL